MNIISTHIICYCLFIYRTLRLVNIQTSECLRIFSGCQDQILSVVVSIKCYELYSYSGQTNESTVYLYFIQEKYEIKNKTQRNE